MSRNVFTALKLTVNVIDPPAARTPQNIDNHGADEDTPCSVITRVYVEAFPSETVGVVATVPSCFEAMNATSPALQPVTATPSVATLPEEDAPLLLTKVQLMPIYIPRPRLATTRRTQRPTPAHHQG